MVYLQQKPPVVQSVERAPASVSETVSEVVPTPVKPLQIQESNPSRFTNDPAPEYLAMLKRIESKGEKEKELVNEIVTYMENDSARNVSVDNLPVDSNGVYELKPDVEKDMIRDEAFRSKWVQFMKLVEEDEEERIRLRQPANVTAQ